MLLCCSPVGETLLVQFPVESRRHSKWYTEPAQSSILQTLLSAIRTPSHLQYHYLPFFSPCKRLNIDQFLTWDASQITSYSLCSALLLSRAYRVLCWAQPCSIQISIWSFPMYLWALHSICYNFPTHCHSGSFTAIPHTALSFQCLVCFYCLLSRLSGEQVNSTPEDIDINLNTNLFL
jgi:hypothetical protein